MIKKILIRAPNWIGDAVMAIPTLSALRANFKGAEITLLAKPPVAALFERHPSVDRLLIYEASGKHAGLLGRWRLIRSLRRERFDLAVLLQNAFEAALIAILAGVPERIGYAADGRSLLLTRSLSRKEAPRHQREAYFYLTRLFASIKVGERLGRTGEASETGAPSLVVAEEERRSAAAFLKSHGIAATDCLIGINPGAAYGSSKRWSPGRFAEVADCLAERHQAKALIFGSASEATLAERIQGEMKHPAVVSLAGKTTIREMMALIAQCRLFVTNDSGPMHVASALGVPVVAVFGPATDPAATSPSGGRALIVQTKVDCSPCAHRECPIDHRCMERVSVEAVVEKAEALLRERENIAAVFLDRDGTVNQEMGHLDSLEKFSLIPGAAAAIARLNRRGIPVVLVTNQSGVARGLFTEDFVGEVHRHLQARLAEEGARLDGIYYCPHHPDFVSCDCRKPAMGMIHRAVEERRIDLSRSYIVGDKPLDMALAQGGAKGILVRTGYGEASLREMDRMGKRPDHVAADLAEAVGWILEDIQKRDEAR